MSGRGEDEPLANDALQAYNALLPAERAAFFDRVAQEFAPDPEVVGRCADSYRQDPSSVHLARLLRAVEPPHQELFRRLNAAPGGTRMLVAMRRHLLSEVAQHPQWTALEADLARLLTGWFNRAFLELRRIDWQTSAAILEKLIEYEAVHEIQGWPDLRRRLEADRRCYGLFHPALPDEPIIFIEVALVEQMSARVQPLVDPDSPVADPGSATCAIFYSITNCHEGLRGIPFGNFLIRRAADELCREFPRLRTLATISPIPGFLGWLAARARRNEPGPQDAALSALMSKLENPRWFADQNLGTQLQRELTSLCAYYLLHAKHGQEPLDPVARFHLRNGARIERLNWLGDTSASGVQRSAGLTVNYLYRLDDLQRNFERYSREHRIPASGQVERQARQSFLAREQVRQQ